jgi:hypothetical protein
MPIDARVPRDAPTDAEGIDTVTDTTQPTVFATVPTNGTVAVSRSATITVTFDEPVMGVSTSTFVVSSGGSQVTGTVAAQSTATYVFTPSTMLPANATVTATLSSSIMDLAGNPLAFYTFSFDTAP